MIDSLDRDQFFKLWEKTICVPCIGWTESNFKSEGKRALLEKLIKSRKSEEDRYRCIRDILLLIKNNANNLKSGEFGQIVKNFIQKLTLEQFKEFYTNTDDEKIRSQIKKYATYEQMCHIPKTYVVGEKRLEVTTDLESSQKETKKFVDSLSTEEKKQLCFDLEDKDDYEGLFWIGYAWDNFEFEGYFSDYSTQERCELCKVALKYKKYSYHEIERAVIRASDRYGYYNINLLAMDPDFVNYSLDSEKVLETFLRAFDKGREKKKTAEKLIDSLDRDQFFKLWEKTICVPRIGWTDFSEGKHALLKKLIKSRNSEEDRYRCIRDILLLIKNNANNWEPGKLQAFVKNFIQKLTLEQFKEFYTRTDDEEIRSQIKKYATYEQLFHCVLVPYAKKTYTSLPTFHSVCDYASLAVPYYFIGRLAGLVSGSVISRDPRLSPTAYLNCIALGSCFGALGYTAIIGPSDEHKLSFSDFDKRLHYIMGASCLVGLGHLGIDYLKSRRMANAQKIKNTKICTK